MPIHAVALLKLDTPAPRRGVRVVSLDDALLVHTGLDFASDPSAILQRLHDAFGDELDEHDDPRGVLVLPDIAAPRARAYLDVIDEVGEGGQWLRLESQDGHGLGLPDGMGALSAVLGSMLQHMPESVLQAASAAVQGDMDAFSQLSDRVASLMGHGREGVSLGNLAQLVGDGRSLDLTSPAFQQIVQTLEGELEKNPAQVERIRQQFFGSEEHDSEPTGSERESKPKD